MQSQANIVIIGGGITGCSLAYHLARLGQTGVVLLDKGELTSGSTWHAAGLVTQFHTSPALMRMRKYSIKLYRQLQAENPVAGWRQVGSLRVASSPDQFKFLQRQVGLARAIGLEVETITPVEFYLRMVDEHDIPIPAGYHDYLPRVAQIESALARHPLPAVPCHNDLLAENYMDDGQALWLIDFEYSGNNDPTFELGNTCQEQQFDAARQAELCAAYFGSAEPGLLARMALQMIMSDVGWTLWAAIQAQISTIDFDFWGWAVDRWARATAKMDSAEFGKWLAAV